MKGIRKKNPKSNAPFKAIAIKNKNEYFDYGLVIVTAVLCLIGFLMVFSALSYNTAKAFSETRKQIIYVVLGTVCMFMSVKMVNKARAPLLFKAAFAVSVLAMFMLIPLGKEVNGATRWIAVGPITIQPSEMLKTGIILLDAVVIKKFERCITSLKLLIVLWIPTLLSALFLWKYTDNLSSALIVLMITFCMHFVASPNKWKFIIIVASVFLVAVLIVLHYKSIEPTPEQMSSMESFRMRRILAWLHPDMFSGNESNQTVNALYAIGRGGWFGKGIGNSIQKSSIPEAQNDMIFPIICEEAGVFGATFIIIVYGVFLWRVMFVANNTGVRLFRYVCVGVFTHFASQVILHICVTTNVLPNTGVTLPFISSGGSAILMSAIEVGLVLKASQYIRTTESMSINMAGQ